MKLLPSLVSCVYSRVKLFVFAMNSKRRYFIFVSFIYGLEEKNSKSEVVFAVRKKLCVSYQALLPAGWLQNYFNATKVDKRKCHTLQSKSIHKNIFNLKSAGKLRIFSLGRKNQYSYMENNVIIKIV